MLRWLKRLFNLGEDERAQPRPILPDPKPYVRAPTAAPPQAFLMSPDHDVDAAARQRPPAQALSHNQRLLEAGNVLFFDVETTGLHSNDHIVSLGMLLLKGNECTNNEMKFDCLHLIYDPGKKSHPEAEIIHGYDDWTLRHQEPFSGSAAIIHDLVSRASLLVAHNAEFDIPFLKRDLERAGYQMPDRRVFCTMQAWREAVGGRAGLASIIKEWGLHRDRAEHSAIEDSWFLFLIWAKLRAGMTPTPFEFHHLSRPSNFRDPPPRPEGPLPRRKRRPTQHFATPPSPE